MQRGEKQATEGESSTFLMHANVLKNPRSPKTFDTIVLHAELPVRWSQSCEIGCDGIIATIFLLSLSR
jgi:hypothetical protein